MKYNHRITVSAQDIDELGHVNNVVYVRYAQEAATAHWNVIATDEVKKQVIWVVLRHEIDYLNPAFETDELIATTWVGETHGVKSIRFVELTHASSNKLIAKIKTTWCMLDATTLKPKRIDNELIKNLQN